MTQGNSIGWQRLVVAVALLLALAGGTARFVHLDKHFYFHDEATTSLRLSGRTSADVTRILAGHWTNAGQIAALQRPRGSVIDTVHSLAVDDPQHPPLFFVAERFWADLAGPSIKSMRALAALFGLLGLLSAGWLVRELCGPGSRSMTMIAVALLALSPFEILYSQEAREYSLWVAVVGGASAVLLRAIRMNSRPMWALYGVAVAAALYTFPNTALVVLGHAGFVILEEGRRRGLLAPFAAAVACAFLVYLPWVGVMVLERGALLAGTDWTSAAVSFSTLARSWLVVFSLGVLDERGGGTPAGATTLLFAGIVALQLAALATVKLRGARSLWRFLMCLVVPVALPLMLADLTLGGIRSLNPRFLAPAYLGLAIALAFMLDNGLAAAQVRTRASSFLLAIAIVGAGAWSFIESSRTPVWWNQDDGAAADNLAVSEALNRTDRPILLSTGMGTLLQMSHYLRPNVRIRVVLDGRAPSLPASSTVFAYGSPANGTSAHGLRILLRDLRRRFGDKPQAITLALPCCGAGIKAIPKQFWLVSGRPAAAP